MSVYLCYLRILAPYPFRKDPYIEIKMVYAYIRVSTAEQSGSSQEYEIKNWAQRQGISIDRWETESVSGTVLPKKRKLGKLIRRMKADDLLVCTEISRLGRNMLMVMSILNDCSFRNIRSHTIKDNFDLNNNINYGSFVQIINESCPINLRWLKALYKNKVIIKQIKLVIHFNLLKDG